MISVYLLLDYLEYLIILINFVRRLIIDYAVTDAAVIAALHPGSGVHSGAV